MKYSVIIPVYNVEKYINRCVKSILSQRYNDLEIILIDNGSTDLSGSICDTYASEYSNISVYHIENHGVGSARNFGLSKARGEFIYFVDSDDYLVGNLFAEFEDKLAPDLDLLVFSYYNSFEQYELGEDVRFNLKVYRNVNEVYLSQDSYYVYVIGRKGSAMSGYNPKRLQYQLQELKLVDNLLSDWNLDSSGFDKTIKSRILMSNIYNISKQNTQFSSKVEYVKDICENKDIKSFIHKEENDLKPFTNYLLKQKRYSTVLFLKMVQALIKRS